MKGLRLQRPRAERGKLECRLSAGREGGGKGDGISGEKERSVGEGRGRMAREGGPIAGLGATSRRQTGHDARPTNRAFLIANTRSLGEFPVHPRANMHPGRPPPPAAIYCGEFRFPSVVFSRRCDHLQIGGG